MINRLYEEGMEKVEQFFDLEGNQIPPDIVCNMFNMGLLEYNQLWSAIPKAWKILMKTEAWEGENEFRVEKYVQGKNIVSKFYRELTDNYEMSEELYKKWSEEIESEMEYNAFLVLFQYIYKITNHGKYRSFQYKMLHRVVILNEKLYKWGKVDSPLCTICQKETETVNHIFLECQIVQKLWKSVQKLCEEKTKIGITIDKTSILLNLAHDNPRHLNNFIVLVAKHYIYAQRCLGEKI